MRCSAVGMKKGCTKGRRFNVLYNGRMRTATYILIVLQLVFTLSLTNFLQQMPEPLQSDIGRGRHT